MIGSEKITWQQCSLLVMLFSVGTSVLAIPSSLAVIAKQDAWIAPILGMIIGISFIWLYIKVGIAFPSMNLMETNELVFGKWIGRAVSLLFSIFCLMNSSQVLFYVGNFVTTQVMPETPVEAIQILFMIIIVMGVRLGLETLARTAEIFIPWVFILYIIFLLSISPKIELKNIEPVFEVGIRPILHAAISYISYSCLPLFVLLAFFPKALNNERQFKKSLYLGFVGGSIVMIILIGTTIMVLGPDMTSRLSYAVYALAKVINVGNFLQRIEAIIAGIWFITIYFKLTFYFFASVLSLSQLLKLGDYRILVYPMGAIVVSLSLIVYPNTAYMGKWDTETWIPYVFTLGFFYPFLLVVISKVKQYFVSK